MQDLADHPFSAENVASESGAPDRSERSWLKFADECERLFGHSLDGNDPDGKGDGYSIDEAHEHWERGTSAQGYVTMAASRERYRIPA
ncbi:hypothetical protein JP75_07835 [Devosia riboflavina]|uniref:Uncharacterized protein n=1 Tax=Devosia riboflavina TaxID=46914 RepID=A0A087M3K1_9HYPH|nr:hypothetical protein [Devosia riboflavina]KFL31454.1 hypothetical protein JP75_07835 [Devosia riboflavina]